MPRTLWSPLFVMLSQPFATQANDELLRLQTNPDQWVMQGKDYATRALLQKLPPRERDPPDRHLMRLYCKNGWSSATTSPRQCRRQLTGDQLCAILHCSSGAALRLKSFCVPSAGISARP
jgi:hypothetical protein